MIKITDKRRLLNLDPTVIYLMLTPEERLAYEKKLRMLNEDAFATKGLFRFDIVEKSDSPYEQLPEEMVRATRECNVFVRLINSIHGIFCYGLELVDFEEKSSSLSVQLMQFVEEVCKENMLHLEILKPRGSSFSMQAMNYYNAHQLFWEVFESALNLDTDDLAEARRIIEKAANSHGAQTSHDLMEGVLNNRLASKIEKERLEREAPKVRPEIKVEIKNVPTGRTTKSRGEKYGLGIEITINDETPIPVYFTHVREGNASMGGYHVTFLYLALLLAKKEDVHIRRRDFTSYPDPYTQLWLRKKLKKFQLYKTLEEIYGVKNKDKVAELTAESKKLTQAKANINTILWKVLSDQYKDAYHYLCVHRGDKEHRTSRYDIGLESEQIIVPDCYLD